MKGTVTRTTGIGYSSTLRENVIGHCYSSHVAVYPQVALYRLRSISTSHSSPRRKRLRTRRHFLLASVGASALLIFSL